MPNEFHIRRTTRYTETACPPCPPPQRVSSCGCPQCQSSAGESGIGALDPGAIGCSIGGVLGTAVCPGVGTVVGAVIGNAWKAFKDK